MTKLSSRGALARWGRALAVALAGASAVRALPPEHPVPVSPGEIGRPVAIAGRCPTFSWTAAPGARGYELSILELPESGAEPRIVLRRELPPATSWTPALADCLTPGRSYAWAVRALGVEAAPWSEARQLALAVAPSDEEIAAAIEVLQRAAGAGAPAGAERPAARATVPRPGAPSPPPGPLSLPAAVAAVRGEMPGTAGELVGVAGVSSSPGGAGAYGLSQAASGGVGLWGTSTGTAGTGVLGEATATVGQSIGLKGTSQSTDGVGAMGLTMATTGVGFGVVGGSLSPDGYGVYGTGLRQGVFGNASDNAYGFGVQGRYTGVGSGGAGVLGQASTGSGAAAGVRGETNTDFGAGVYGEAMASCCANQGVFGRTGSSGGAGVLGRAISIWGGIGVQGISDSSDGIGVKGEGSGIGVSGSSVSDYGVEGTSEENVGVRGYSNSPFHWAVLGESDANVGIRGTGPQGGVVGESDHGPGVRGTSAHEDGLYGEASADGKSGLFAVNTNPLGWAAYFTGNVHVNGTFSKFAGSFTIDHPLDPLHRTLSHSFVESPDMKNLYDGLVELDARGEAWIELPAWFEALNGELRYQLTPIGSWSPAWIGEPVAGNRFQIRGQPGARISWQVTGTRQDVWARRHRIGVEAEKPLAQQGMYLHPAEWEGERAGEAPRPRP